MECDPATEWGLQFVIQFPLDDSDHERFEELLELQERLEKLLLDRSVAEVDGNDFGSGEMNIFLFTNEPEKALDKVRPLVEEVASPAEYRVAYRAFDRNEFHPLWPKGLKEFAVK